MIRRNVLIGSVAAIVAAVGLTTAYADFGGSRHGWGGHGLHARLCGPDREAKLEAAITYVRYTLDIRAEQEAPWVALVGAVRDATGKVDAVCAETEGASVQGLDARLDRTEAMLVTGLAVLRDLRPALDAFYAVLDDGQRQQFDALAEHRRG
ncbi:MAG: hypothetical protein EXQ94_00390 [Alphaproteobacteria bacterium]|nr:hypothetical protein [Alphaproteobacteria bacterium]